MGTIGLSFGSPTSGQGIDVASTVTQMVTQLQGAERPYKSQLTALQSQDTVISNLGSLLSTLSSDITALTDPVGVLSGKLGSSSDPNTLTLLSANTAATAGSHTVTVQQLAQTSTEASSAVAAYDTLSGSFSFHIGTGSSQSISVDPANNTIAGLAATINQAGLGVTASVVTDGSGSRLSLISQTSGAAGQINIDSSSLSDSASGTVSLIAGQAGQDAQFTIDGIQTTSASNTVTGAISGVTMQLLGVSSSPTTPVQVQIDNDTASVTSSLSTLVKDYNAVVSALSAQEGKDASGNAEPLFGSPIISQLQQILSGALTTPSGTSLTSPTQIGLSLNADGRLSLNPDQLTTALNDNFTGVQTLFQNTHSFGLNLEHAVNNAGTGSTTGILSQAQKANSTAESNLNSTISTMDGRIATQQTNLTNELNAANQTLQEIPMQLNMVNEIYSAIT
ncbi:MAG: flagellar filament capping protein FliD, partial [Acidobacteriaceae bacterium]